MKKTEFPEQTELDELVKVLDAIPFLFIVSFSDVIKRYTEIFFKTPLHFSYLGFLARNGGVLPPSRMAQLLFRSKDGVTKLTDALEAKGYVKRVPNPQDRRAVQIMITHNGLNRLKNGATKGKAFVSDIVNTLSDEEMDELIRYLRRLRRVLIEKLNEA
jgi:DNA-binding MarR family transcriptional regulator